MNPKKWLMVVLVAVLLVAALPLAAAAAPGPANLPQDDPPEESTVESGCNPAAQRLAEQMGVDCAVIEDYLEQGVGLGVIAKAWALSQAFPTLYWEDLVARHTGEESLGWGTLKKAYWLAEVLGADPEALLSAHAAGTGWGEMLQQYRVGPGKPLWAAQGPPPWSNGHGQSDEEDGGAADGQSEERHDNGNHNGHGNGNGNSNGNGHGSNR